MKITYDIQADAKYISIREGEVAATDIVEDWLMVDKDISGTVLGIEVLGASENFLHVDTDGKNLLRYAPANKQLEQFGGISTTPALSIS